MQTIKKISAIAAAAGTLLSFSPAFAVTRTASDNNTTAVNFCTRINDTTAQLNSLLTKLSSNRGNLRESMLTNLGDRKRERSSQVQSIRDKAHSQFVADLNNLDSRAKTDAQKTAVATFKSAVTAAYNTRNQAIDAAVAAYQSAAQSEITSREDKVKNAASTFQSAVQAAIAKAKSDCSSGVTPATARQTMNTSIRTANQTFRTVVTGLAEGTLVTLAQTRNKAIQTADSNFRKAVEQARTTLKAAFGDKSTDPSPSPTPDPTETPTPTPTSSGE